MFNNHKKTVYTLSVDNKYAPEITALTFPLIKAYAHKIEADFQIITERKFPEFPPACEKFQIYELSKENKDDWSIFFDADTIVHPDFFDVTTILEKHTTCSNASDFSLHRFRPDEYFLRDGRMIGKGNWIGIASDWCRDYWQPLTDITIDEAISNIFPTVQEVQFGVTPRYLLDDYIVSRNIAKYGLKHKILLEFEATGLITGLLAHQYLKTDEEKVIYINQVMTQWGIS